MAHYLFNLMKTDPTGQSLHAQAAAFLHSDLWPVAPTEPHAQALDVLGREVGDGGVGGLT